MRFQTVFAFIAATLLTSTGVMAVTSCKVSFIFHERIPPASCLTRQLTVYRNAAIHVPTRHLAPLGSRAAWVTAGHTPVMAKAARRISEGAMLG